MCEYFEGLGVTEKQLEPGTVVMVPVGRMVAHINGDPTLIAWAVVIGPAEELVPGQPRPKYWLDVYAVPGGEPMPLMYDPREILGVPALGLSMQGGPDAHPEITGR